MDYKEFKDVAVKEFLSYMPEEYQDMEVVSREVEKTNRKLDGISLRRAGAERMLSPVIYINDIYEEYVRTGNLQEALQDAAGMMDAAFRENPAQGMDFGTAKGNIVFGLVNTMQNKDMLKKMPHREFQDLSVIYTWILNVENGSSTGVLVNNGLAEKLGMDEGQLFAAAKENTRRILPPVVKSMNEVMREIFVAGGMPQEVADLMVREQGPEQPMWIITNENKIHGAASMLYEAELHRLAESAGADLYILPSSVHEVIAVPAEFGEPEVLAQMVSEVNMNEVDISERLSDHVYHYDRCLRKVTLAAGAPGKMFIITWGKEKSR